VAEKCFLPEINVLMQGEKVLKALAEKNNKNPSIVLDFKNAPFVDKLENRLMDVLLDSEGPIRDMCHHILKAGGKRIRPLIVLYSGMIFSEPSQNLMDAAVAAELIHMASLVHDDIVDNSLLRRNRPSINKIWGNEYAVLCGDYLFAKAFGILSEKRLIKSMNFMVEAITNMCHGEIRQASDRFNFNVSIESYYIRIAKKTAIFLQSCAKSGSSIGGANEKDIETIGEYGLNIGYAFQIIDDILDFCGEVDVMGKEKYEDLRQGNITLPVILLMNKDAYRNWLLEMVEGRRINEKDIDNICNALKESGVLDESSEIAASHIKKAKKCLDLLPKSNYTDFLYNLSNMLQSRIN